MIRDGQPSPQQARRMAKVFVIATLLGGLVVFLNVTMRSYNIRMQQAELKSKEAAAGASAPTGQAPEAAGSSTPEAAGTSTPEATDSSAPVNQPQASDTVPEEPKKP